LLPGALLVVPELEGFVEFFMFAPVVVPDFELDCFVLEPVVIDEWVLVCL
jgi:hypothetical protein